MKYFLPDAQDLVDPSFDFKTESRSVDRIRHQDDLYAHEVFSARAFDGILISKAIVDGTGGAGTAKYTPAQRRRLLREGVKTFFRAENHRWGSVTFMGDCGAFSYLKDNVPPYTVEEVAEFYDTCGFDYGISVDHIIPDWQPQWDLVSPPSAVRERQELTLDLARDFFKLRKKARLGFTPMGVAQGWSPSSYARAVSMLQKIGYQHIALGGMVPLKTPDILSCVTAVDDIRKPNTQLHLLGVTRLSELSAFSRHGVVSFDSTSPLRQAFKDAKDNYYTPTRTYSAIRVPQVNGNPRLMAKIRAGTVDHDTARRAEQQCLKALAEYEARKRSLRTVLKALSQYAQLYDPESDRTEIYREALEARPWADCSCDVCRKLGYHVILFRGAERNRRRGFHNTWVFYRRLAHALSPRAGMSQRLAG